MVRRWLEIMEAALLATFFLLDDRLSAGESVGYWYGTYRYAYNPGYYARRYPAPRPGYAGYYHGWGYGRGSKTSPGMSGPVYLRYAPPARAPAARRMGK